MSYHFHSSLYRITKAVRIQPCHSWVSKKRLSYFLAVFPENHWFWPVWMYYWGGGGVCLDNVTLPAWPGIRNCLGLRHHGLNLVHLVRCLFLLSPFCCGGLFRYKKACRRPYSHYTTKEDKYWDELNLDLEVDSDNPDPEHALHVSMGFVPRRWCF